MARTEHLGPKELASRDRFGRYRLVRPLTETHFGPEHLAVHVTTGGLVEVCRLLVVRAELTADPEATLHQLRQLLTLDHPALERVMDAGNVEGNLYVASAYQPGRDLSTIFAKHARRGALPEGMVLYVGLQLLDGLRHARRHGAGEAARCHGRLGAESVFVTADGRVKLHHMGIAAALGLSPDDERASCLEATDGQAVAELVGELLTPERLAEHPALNAVVGEARRGEEGQRFADPEGLLEGLRATGEELGEPWSAEEAARLMEELFRAALTVDARELASLIAIDSKRLHVDIETSRASSPGEVMPPPDTVVGERYRVIRPIGEGGMGVVVEAEHVHLGRRVALKILLPALSQDPVFSERFRREARSASTIGHRHIVDVTDFGETEDGRLFYAMELLDGESLGDLMEREGRIEQGRAARILLQVCDAVDAAHAEGIVHRDLKPDNLMLTPSEEDGRDFVRVLDFGIAFAMAEDNKRVTRTDQIIGTPDYMAPEQVRGPVTDPRTDVYAAAAILYEMLTGHRPFEAETSVEVLSAHLKERVVPPRLRAPSARVHPALEAVVMRGLEKAPEDRYQSMADMAFDLWAALEAMVADPEGRQAEVLHAEPPAPEGEPTGAAPTEPGPAPGQTGVGPGPTEERASSPSEAAIGEEPRRWGAAVVTVVSVLVAIAALGWVAYQQYGRSDELRGAAGAPADAGAGAVGMLADAAATEASAPAGGGISEGDAGGDSADDYGDGALAASDGGDGGDAEPSDSRRSARRRWKVIRARMDAAAEHLRLGQPAKAASVYRSVLRRAPRNAAALAGLGRAEFELGNHGAAARHLGRATKLRPRSVSIRLSYAGALLRAGRRADAQRQYRAVLRLDPDNAVAKRMVETGQ